MQGKVSASDSLPGISFVTIAVALQPGMSYPQLSSATIHLS